MTPRQQRLHPVAATVALLLLGVAPPALGWSGTGHRVVARLTWETLDAPLRSAVLTLLAQAPTEADLAAPGPASRRRKARSGYPLFEEAGVWPDTVRRPEPPSRHAFDRPSWHFVNLPWRAGAVEVTGAIAPLPEGDNLVTRLRTLRSEVADPGLPPAERAVALAWILHLVADVHQPLHCSLRLSEHPPTADPGGRAFTLGGNTNLHDYWDRAISRGHPRRPGERRGAYVRRLAAAVVAAGGADGGGSALAFAPEAWAREGVALARREVYPPSLHLGTLPPTHYAARAVELSASRLALASRRLAHLLGELFAPPAATGAPGCSEHR